MRSTAIALAVLVATAGCLSSARTDPADSMLDDARGAAADELDDPQLIRVWGIEPPIDAREDGDRLTVSLDGTPGDGQAPGWAYRFEGEQHAAVVLTASRGGVIASFFDRDVGDALAGTPIGDWSVSSEDAAAALAGNASWPTMDENTTVAWELAPGGDPSPDGHPVWRAYAERGLPDPFGSDSIVGVVDATTGEVLDVGPSEDSFGEPGSPGQGGCQREEASGQVTPVEGVSVSARLEHTGSVRVEAESTGAGPLNVTLAKENGTVWAETFEVQGSASLDQREDELPAGEYTATASTGQGAHQVDLEITTRWGTGGFCPDFDVGPAAGLHPAGAWLIEAREGLATR